MQFYNRKKELEHMGMLDASKPSFLVITGKRRVGKTELIRQYSRGRKALYLFVDSNKSIDVLMDEFSRLTQETLELPDYIKLDEPENFLKFITSYDNDLVLAIDEFQRFLKVYPSFITQLQKYWDMKPDSCKVFLIVSGSSIGMIKKIFIEAQAPLFKRADNIMTLKPFTISETFEMLENMGINDLEEKLNLYFLFGGTVYYYRLFEKYQCTGFKDALEKLILSDLAPLKDEVRDILIEEFGKEHSTYYEIISAISQGKCSKTEISEMTHVSASSLSAYFYDLIDLLDLVEHRIPVTDKPQKSKRGRYFLKDNFFRFYGRFIYPMLSQYMGGNYPSLTEKVLQEWQSHTGKIFEDIVREQISEKMLREYPIIGNWWNRRGDEIDILGINKEKGKALAVEIKNKELTEDDARDILRYTIGKTEQIHELSKMDIKAGIVARTIEGRDDLEKDGFLVWELKDIFL
ncbi:ATP-binding protein [Methanolobus psychrotolerans]|uniref:ATP-binding protein n=1 Tax=Methanolobus psychrotolerans TaxID=1874706 RepID=UPI001F5CBC0C|nr:ATP-binding protein [Methanolobus psychrotolerans]